MKWLLWIALLAIYIIPRYVGDAWFNRLPEYIDYLIEIAYVALVALCLRRGPRAGTIGAHPWRPAVVMFFLGMGIAGICRALDVGIPFNLHVEKTWILLLVVGPIVEELVFRFALWELATQLRFNCAAKVTGTALLFSLAHAMAYTRVPDFYLGFVLFQTIYTFGLGLAWGWKRETSGGIGAPLAMHFLFNAGFAIIAWI